MMNNERPAGTGGVVACGAIPQEEGEELAHVVGGGEDTARGVGEPDVQQWHELPHLIPTRQLGQVGGERQLCILIESEGRKLALGVDDLLGQQQVVVKSLEANYRRVPYMSGATILGDGRVALILDAADLVRRSAPAAAA